MLKDDFYTITALDKQALSADFTVHVNENHAIFKGHFPGQPVVPGACLLQMAKEITEHITESKLQMLRADELKFLSPINPFDNNILLGSINYSIGGDNEISITSTFHQNNAVCFKCKAVFVLK